MNERETIIKVRDALLKQGCKAGYRSKVSSNFFCEFLDSKGNRCAIGHLLTEEQVEGPSKPYL